MKKKVPTCAGCEHVEVYARYRERVHYFCKHPLFKTCGLATMIPSKERGKTSPQWCPKRVHEKAIEEAAAYGHPKN